MRGCRSALRSLRLPATHYSPSSPSTMNSSPPSPTLPSDPLPAPTLRSPPRRPGRSYLLPVPSNDDDAPLSARPHDQSFPLPTDGVSLSSRSDEPSSGTTPPTSRVDGDRSTAVNDNVNVNAGFETARVRRTRSSHGSNDHMSSIVRVLDSGNPSFANNESLPDGGGSRAAGVAPSPSRYSPVTSDDLPPTPSKYAANIITMLRHVWGVAEPRPYQVDMIFHLVFRKVFLVLVRKCGEGKSLVMLGMATMLKGITVVMVPLIGLGSDQANKSKRIAKRVYAYHCDEFRGDDLDQLQRLLLSYHPSKKRAIILFISPQQMCHGTPWSKFLFSIGGMGFLSAICVDEAHACVEQSETFRPELKSGLFAMRDLAAHA